MLFVSPHPQFQKTGIMQPEDKYHEKTGQYLRTIPGIDALFVPATPNWAIDWALANPRFTDRWRALPEDFNPRAYVASYDTDAEAAEHGWDEDTKQFVEEFLLSQPDYGQFYFLAELPPEIRAKPWPNYDSTHHNQIVKVAREIGVPLDVVVEYERKHKNRPAIIEKAEEELARQAQQEADEELVPA